MTEKEFTIRIASLIDNALNENANKRNMASQRAYIKKVVTEEIVKYMKHTINEDDSQAAKRKFVLKSLKSGKFNNAELMRQLWNPKDQSEEDTYRSLFSKKTNGTPDADGTIRSFTNDEITKLSQILASE